ncbi:hypothetical protein [Actinoplanes sp. NPDC049118]|uniref:hypothetical protein n=1 Tax=Actinoplanes sp. NPDC049118 TaxID=3155769 RepID=UPI0033ED32B9
MDVSPLDPDSPKGREVAARLTRTLALIELQINERERAAGIEPRTDSAPACQIRRARTDFS